MIALKTTNHARRTSYDRDDTNHKGSNGTTESVTRASLGNCQAKRLTNPGLRWTR